LEPLYYLLIIFSNTLATKINNKYRVIIKIDRTFPYKRVYKKHQLIIIIIDRC